jgi:Cu2+-exporting ATPase
MLLGCFVRAWKSVITWNLNMFTLIGIGSGLLFYLACLACSFQNFFQMKKQKGTVHLYFEATTVILTLVLLGQLLEAKAHSRTTWCHKNY